MVLPMARWGPRTAINMVEMREWPVVQGGHWESPPILACIQTPTPVKHQDKAYHLQLKVQEFAGTINGRLSWNNSREVSGCQACGDKERSLEGLDTGGTYSHRVASAPGACGSGCQTPPRRTRARGSPPAGAA